jgi:hypothetical protein
VVPLRHLSTKLRLPAAPETVAAFLASEAGRRVRPSTIGRRVAAIRYAHKLAGFPIPTDDERVRATVRGIRWSLGAAPNRKGQRTAACYTNPHVLGWGCRLCRV